MSQTKLPTIVISGLLIVVGVGFYFATGRASLTALIPAFLGLPLLLCGLASVGPRSTMIAMHLAVLLAALGAIAAGGRIASSLSEPNALVITELAIMFVLCVSLTTIYVRSFIRARKKTVESA